jgi:hypothetical protein
MHKKPKIDRDNIKDLGQCRETPNHKFP